MNALEIAAIGLQQNTERLRVISHNVANISTPGYKRQVSVAGAFSNAMDSAQAVVATQLDQSAGKLMRTGSPLDVALAEREFLMVQTNGGAPALVRGGSLQVDPRGKLVTAQGLAVQGTGGELTVPPTATQVRIDAAGKVWADEALAGTLRVVRMAPGEGPVPLGEGLYAVPPGTQALQPVDAPALQVGHLEASNVSSAQEMVALMNTTRHAETMVRLIQGSDELMEKAIRKLGEL